jgi:hypothetical protein
MAVAIYTASEFAGTYRLIGQTSGADSSAAVVSVGISLPAKLTPGAAHYTLVGAQREKHPDAWNMQPTMFNALNALADDFFGTFQQQVAYNDASLPNGGRFDIDGSWGGPHCDHRLGQGADLRTNTMSQAQLDKVASFWGDRFGWKRDPKTGKMVPLYYLDEGDPVHWHLKSPPEP